MVNKAKKAEGYPQDLDEQCYDDGKYQWRVSRLLKLSEDLEVFELPLQCLNIYNLYPKDIASTKEFVEHVKRVNLADLKCPIILDEEGYVMDGRHRVCKALLENKKSIKAVRFSATPSPCIVKEDS